MGLAKYLIFNTKYKVLHTKVISNEEINVCVFVCVFLCICVFQTIAEEKIQENCAIVGTYLLTELAKLRNKYEIIGDVRGKGLQIGVEMVTDKVRK